MNRSISKSFCGLALLSVCALSFSAFSQTIPIATYADLLKIGVDADYPLSGSYELTANIDASPSRTAATAFRPIGRHLDTAFTGVFDGKGHRITGLFLNPGVMDGLTNVGLFGVANHGAVIRNLTVIADTVRGHTTVGILAGRAENSFIDSCRAEGVVIGVQEHIGGLVGMARNTEITASSSSGQVRITAGSLQTGRVGGLVGSLFRGSVAESVSSCTVTVRGAIGMSGTGGLVGHSDESVISGSSFSGFIDATATSNITEIGGVAGFNGGEIVRCHSTGGVTGGNRVGGLVGRNTGTITASYFESATGRDVSATGNHIGGLVGVNDSGGTITNSRAAGNVSGGRGVGGLVGLNRAGGVIERSFFKSDYSILPILDDDYYIPRDSVRGADSTGGLVGVNRGVVRQSYADVYLTSSGAMGGVGGLIGFNDSLVEQSFSTGYLYTGFAEGMVGGLIGRTAGVVRQCYSRAQVSGGNRTGGLVGFMSGGTIAECYAANEIRGADTVGGLVGSAVSGSIIGSDCFWDLTVSGVTVSARNGGHGKTTEEMLGRSMRFLYINAGWDFRDVWVDQDETYPVFVYMAEGQVGPPVSVRPDRRAPVRTRGTVPQIAARGRVVNVFAPNGIRYQIRVIDLRGRVAARFSASGAERFHLGNIPAGRYLIESSVNGKRANVLSHTIRGGI